MANGEFTDKVKILIKAGDGGDGMNSFKAYKGKPACGPDGGDGGKGGDVYFVGDKDMNDLFFFRFTSRFIADNGETGGTNRCFGKSGKDVMIKVPLGTLVRDEESGRLICDVFEVLGVWVFSYQKDQSVDMNKVLASVIVSLYIISATSSIVMIRDNAGGEYYWYFIFIGAWVTDTFAYFTGMLFGKHKLIPAVSPKKTVEGAIGGIVFCMVFFVIYGVIVNSFTQYDISLVVLAVAGFLSAIVSMIGDLSMSVIKRTYGIKDYGKIFPGHGGVLDRFDSILAVAVVLALVLV